MAVTPHISTNAKLYVDVDDTHIDPAAATYERIYGMADIGDQAGADGKDVMSQGDDIQVFVSGLNDFEWNISLRWDQADTTVSSVTHQELLTLCRTRKKVCWQLDEPPGTVGCKRRRRLGFVKMIDIPNALGEVITANVSIQLCGTPADSTVP